MKGFRFTVYGVPKAQPRTKACRRGRHAGVYDPGTADGWKALVALAARQEAAFPGEPWTGPVYCSIDVYFPRPKRLYRQTDPDGPLPHYVKPDRDNCEKAALDALTNAGLWRDDAQVCAGPVQKFYHEKTGRARAVITVRRLPVE